MQKVYQIVAFAFCVLLPLAATAQSSTDDEYSARYNKCMDASGGITVNMLNCIADEIAAQDTRLNTAYSDARSTDGLLALIGLAGDAAWLPG